MHQGSLQNNDITNNYLMDKGKNPILEDEQDMSSFLPKFDNFGQSKFTTSVGAKLQVLNNVGFHQVKLEEGLANETSALDEMEEAGENFFSKFISINLTTLIDSPSPAFEPSSVNVPTSSNPAPPTSPPTQVQAPLETIMSLPVPAPAPAPAPTSIELRKAMSPVALAELALHDPKKAKRIMINRMSAVRAKEKKKLYIFMLEHRLQCLRSESAELSAKFTFLQSDNSCLNAESNRLKESIENIKQQIYLQDSLNDEIRNEIEGLNILKSQLNGNGGTMINIFSSSSNNNNHATNALLAKPQFSQLQIQTPDQWQQPQYHHQQQHGQRYYHVQYEHGQPSQLSQNLQQYQYQIRNKQQVMPHDLQIQQNQHIFVQQM